MADSKSRILLIDDEQDLAEVWSMWLESRGYSVQVSCDAEEGYQHAISDAPDLILLDIAMPKVDGWTICQQLRQDCNG